MHRRRGVSETPSVRMRMLGSSIRSKGSDTSEPKVFYGTQRAPQLRSRSSCDAADYHWRVVTGHGACNWGPCRVDSLVVYRAGVVTSALGVRWSRAMYCRTVDAPPQRGWSHGTGRSFSHTAVAACWHGPAPCEEPGALAHHQSRMGAGVARMLLV